MLVAVHVGMVLVVVGQGLLIFVGWQQEQNQEEFAAAHAGRLGKTVGKGPSDTFGGGMWPNDDCIFDNDDEMEVSNPIFRSNTKNDGPAICADAPDGGGEGGGRQAWGQNVQEDAPTSARVSAVVAKYLAARGVGRTKPRTSSREQKHEQQLPRDIGGGDIKAPRTAGRAEPCDSGENTHKIREPGYGGCGGGGSIRTALATGRPELYSSLEEKKHKLRLSGDGGIQAALAASQTLVVGLHRTLVQGPRDSVSAVENFPETPLVLNDNDPPVADTADFRPEEDFSSATASVNACRTTEK